MNPYYLLLLPLIMMSCSQQKSGQSAMQNPEHRSSGPDTVVPVFDGQQSFRYLTAQTNFGPRNPNSTGHRACLTYLAGELTKYADSVAMQSFAQTGYGETLQLTNIFASFNPTAHRRILLIAHWDTRPRADEETDPARQSQPILGANDGASGVAVLLELARLFKTSPPPVGVDILLTDGEDYGSSKRDHNDDLYFLGAKYFARTKPAGYLPEFGILLDMIGDRDLRIPMEQFSMEYAPHVIDMIWTVADELGIPQFVRIPGERVSDDHLALNEAGIPTVDLIDFDYPAWHTLDDTPDRCSPESLHAVGSVLAALIYTRL